jgi:hypothetical protein
METGKSESTNHESAAPAPARRRPRPPGVPLVGLVLLTLVLYGRGWTHSRGAFGDAFHHLINGIFIFDAARHPTESLADPIGFATHYYCHYPAVNLGYYPPGFAIVEASLMAFFGVSPATGQLTVLLLSVLMAVAAYAWIRLRFDPWWSAGTAAVLVTTPLLIDWGRDIMLEVPTVAFMLGAMWGFERALREPRPSWTAVIAAAFFTTLAVWTKQHALMLIGVFVVSIVATRRWHLLREPRMWVGMVWIAVAAIGVIVMTLKVGGDAIGHTTGFTAEHAVDRFNLEQWTSYPKLLLYRFDRPVLVFAGLGLFWVARGKETIISPLLAWIVVFYLMHSYFKAQTDRYACLWVPPFIVLAGIGLKHLPLLRPRGRRGVSIGAVLMTLWIGVAAVRGYQQQIQDVPPDYQRATDDLSERLGPFTCMTFFPDRPGRIAVCMRLAVETRRTPDRDIFAFGRILRAMHVLRDWRSTYGDVAMLNDALRGWNVKYIMTETPRPVDPLDPDDVLGEAVDGLLDPERGFFRAVRSYEVRRDEGSRLAERTLVLYERIAPMEFDPAAAPPLRTIRTGVEVPARGGDVTP